jgi:hypothetical protein
MLHSDTILNDKFTGRDGHTLRMRIPGQHGLKTGHRTAIIDLETVPANLERLATLRPVAVLEPIFFFGGGGASTGLAVGPEAFISSPSFLFPSFIFPSFIYHS